MLINTFRTTYKRFPEKFWIVVGAMFIDMLGGTLLFPFFALYITQRFEVGMTEAGVVLGLSSLFGFFGNLLGGALTDKFGRRNIIIFGLVFSAISTLSLGLVSAYAALLPISAVIGLIGSVSHPAHQAMVADMLPEDRRSEGFSILRVVANFSWIVGPIIGGLVASKSFFLLFVIDAVVSSVVALIFYKLIPETMPAKTAEQVHETIGATFKGYIKVLVDRPFMGYLFVSILCLIVYQQMYSTLSVYMRDVHGFPPQKYGVMLSISAALVVLTQLWVTSKIRHKPPFIMLAVGSLFYMVGFTMFGFIQEYWLFVVALLIIIVGEMIIAPISQTLAAKFAPEDMRGRYMAAFGLAWSLPSAIGPAAAGVILDNFNPNLLWYIGGVILLISAGGYYLLHIFLHRQVRFAPEEKQPLPA